MNETGKSVALGLAIGSGVLFLHAVWPAITDVELRAPILYHEREQTLSEAYIASTLSWVGMALTLWATGEVIGGRVGMKDLV